MKCMLCWGMPFHVSLCISAFQIIQRACAHPMQGFTLACGTPTHFHTKTLSKPCALSASACGAYPNPNPRPPPPPPHLERQRHPQVLLGHAHHARIGAHYEAGVVRQVTREAEGGGLEVLLVAGEVHQGHDLCVCVWGGGGLVYVWGGGGGVERGGGVWKGVGVGVGGWGGGLSDGVCGVCVERGGGRDGWVERCCVWCVCGKGGGWGALHLVLSLVGRTRHLTSETITKK